MSLAKTNRWVIPRTESYLSSRLLADSTIIQIKYDGSADSLSDNFGSLTARLLPINTHAYPEAFGKIWVSLRGYASIQWRKAFLCYKIYFLVFYGGVLHPSPAFHLRTGVLGELNSFSKGRTEQTTCFPQKKRRWDIINNARVPLFVICVFYLISKGRDRAPRMAMRITHKLYTFSVEIP